MRALAFSHLMFVIQAYMYLINCSRTTEAQEEALFCSHECEEAARQLGLPDTGASEERVSNYPPFCYLHRGKSLWFNNLGTSATTCDSDDICICHNGVGCELYHQKLTIHNCKKKNVVNYRLPLALKRLLL